MSSGEKWTEVRRRKKGGHGWDMRAIPFFVAGMSDSTKKIEVRKCFAGFGELVDVYMGKSKNAAGRNYAFVKFANVKDLAGLEEKMQGVVCGGRKLTVNLSRYGRDKSPLTIPNARAGIHSKPYRVSGDNVKVWVPRHIRTFADVIKGQREQLNHPTAKLPLPIQLSTGNCQRNWMTESVLVGEALSLDHMAALPEQFLNGDGCLDSIKYVGGLSVALCFKNAALAKEFLQDNDRWFEWFQCMRFGDGLIPNGDRIAWIKVVGLPPAFWDDDNITKILKGAGKVIVPPDEMGEDVDASLIRVGILTSRKNLVNEEIAICADGKCFNIGLVEFEHKWSPFPLPRPISCNGSEASGDDYDEDGVFDSDGEKVGPSDMEDGEIPASPQVNFEEREELDPTVVEDTFGKELNEELNADAKEDNHASHDVGTTVVEMDRDMHKTNNMVEMDRDMHKINNVVVGQFEGHNSKGPFFNFSCFGPFPSYFPKNGEPNTKTQIVPTLEDAYDESATAGGSKRRKIVRRKARYLPYGTKTSDQSSMPRTFDDPGNYSIPPGQINPPLTPLIPAVGVSPSVGVCPDRNDVCPARVGEIELTVSIGNEIGFHIEQGDTMLAQIVGEHGEISGYP